MPCKIRNIECQVRYEHLCQIECQTECDMECQIACHFGYQIRCQIEWSIDPQEKCQNICQLAVRSKLIKCQKYARYNVTIFARILAAAGIFRTFCIFGLIACSCSCQDPGAKTLAPRPMAPRFGSCLQLFQSIQATDDLIHAFTALGDAFASHLPAGEALYRSSSGIFQRPCARTALPMCIQAFRTEEEFESAWDGGQVASMVGQIVQL